jgi:branched-chain amino acid transport system permease protein
VRRLLGPVVGLVALVVLLALPLYLSTGYLKAGQYVMIGAVGAIGLTLLIGQAGQLSLAHGFFLLAGGTTYAVLSGEQTDDLVGFGLPPLVALLGSAVVSALLGLAFAPVAGRLRGIYLGIASLSLVFIGLYVGQRYSGLTGGTSSGRRPTTFSVPGFSFGSSDPDLYVLGVQFGRTERLWYLFLVLTVIAYLLARGAVRSRPGRAWRAVRDNEAAAAVMGVNVVRTKAVAFAVSSGFAGVAGAMTVLWLTIHKPDESEFGTYGINASIAFLAMVIIGGLGSVPGAVVGAVVVNGLPQVLALVTADSASAAASGAFTPVFITQIIYGAAIVALVLLEPRGLVGIGHRLRDGLTRRGSTTQTSAAGAPPSASPSQDGEK